MSPDDDVLVALLEQHEETEGLLQDLSGTNWSRSSRCDGWSVADVVLHVAQTNELAVASLEDRMAEALAARTGGGGAGPRTIDEGAEHMVRAERGSPPAQVLQRWRDSATAVTSLLRSTDGHDRVTWVAGELSVRTLAVTRLTETWIHTGDVAGALAIKLEPAGRLRHVARLAWRTLPYAFARAGRQMAGPVAFELDGPGGESWDLRLGGQAATTVRGDGVELCLLAARRVEPASTSLEADGPDGAAVLELVRTYA